MLRYGHFDDAAREYVITRPDTPLPWINYLGSEDYFAIVSNTAGRLLVLQGPPPAPPHAVPLQQRPARRRRPLPLRPRRRHRRLLVSVLAADEKRAPAVPLPSRPRLHDHRVESFRDRGRDALLRPARRNARALALAGREPARGSCPPLAVQRRRVLPLGRLGRRDELPAQSLHRRGRGRGRRDLPPRASTASAATTSRTSAVPSRPPDSTPSARRSSARTAAGTGRSRSRKAYPATRSRTGGRPAARTGSSSNARAGTSPARSSSSSATPRTRPRREVRPARLPADRQARASARCSTATATRPRSSPRSSVCATTGRSCSPACRCRRPSRARRPDGRTLEPVPVHGHVQPLALGFAVRVRHRPWDGLPRLQPGSAGLRAPCARARTRAHPRPGRHPVARRRRLPPVPAADQARQRCSRLGLQRRPALADPRGCPRTSRRRATSRSCTSRSSTTTSKARRPRSTSTCGAPSATRSTGSGPTDCR